MKEVVEMTFEDKVASIHAGSVVTYREYTLDRHERKKETLSIIDGVVQTVFNANETLDRETLIQYYGEGFDDIDYLQLATMNCPRIVIGLGLNQNNELDVKIIVLNKDFYNLGLQEIEVTNELDPHNLVEPNYVLSQGGW